MLDYSSELQFIKKDLQIRQTNVDFKGHKILKFKKNDFFFFFVLVGFLRFVFQTLYVQRNSIMNILWSELR